MAAREANSDVAAPPGKKGARKFYGKRGRELEGRVHGRGFIAFD